MFSETYDFMELYHGALLLILVSSQSYLKIKSIANHYLVITVNQWMWKLSRNIKSRTSLESGPYFNCFDDSLSIIGISPPLLIKGGRGSHLWSYEVFCLKGEDKPVKGEGVDVEMGLLPLFYYFTVQSYLLCVRGK